MIHVESYLLNQRIIELFILRMNNGAISIQHKMILWIKKYHHKHMIVYRGKWYGFSEYLYQECGIDCRCKALNFLLTSL